MLSELVSNTDEKRESVILLGGHPYQGKNSWEILHLGYKGVGEA